MRVLLIFVSAAVVAVGQKPAISPGGIVNAASYATGGPSGKAVAEGSIVSVFGQHLATITATAGGFPLPTTLGGTSVVVSGKAAPLFYVSPNQINLQLPTNYPPPFLGDQMVVTTPAGVSDPMPFDMGSGERFDIFTQDGSGCGPGAVLNVASDGGVSLNSPSNSASPGDYITVFGTGIVGFFNEPPDGSPATSNPLSLAVNWSLYDAIFDLALPNLWRDEDLRPRVSWAGRAPGFAGLDQINVRVPDAVREGCAVPLMAAFGGRSQPVTLSIRKGGGACVDPPSAANGLITWEKTTGSSTGSSGTTETFSAAFPSSPGRQAPLPIPRSGFTYELFGPFCPLPGYKVLDAGKVAVQGPGFGPVEAAPTLVDGQRVYRAVLPAGTIQPGSFSVSASGGEVAAFQSTLRIGSGINVTSSFPPGAVVRTAATGGPLGIDVNWTGGDPDSWVTVKLIAHQGIRDVYNFFQVRATVGTAQVSTDLGSGPAEIALEVTPDPAQVPTLSAPGLSLGGQHTWKYTYRFGGLTLQ